MFMSVRAKTPINFRVHPTIKICSGGSEGKEQVKRASQNSLLFIANDMY